MNLKVHDEMWQCLEDVHDSGNQYFPKLYMGKEIMQKCGLTVDFHGVRTLTVAVLGCPA